MIGDAFFVTVGAFAVNVTGQGCNSFRPYLDARVNSGKAVGALFGDYLTAKIIGRIAKKATNRFGTFERDIITGTLGGVPNISVKPILKFCAQFENLFPKLENKTRFTQ